MKKKITIILVSAVCIFVVTIPLLIGNSEQWKPSKTEFSIQYIAIIISAISAAAVAITLILQRQQLQELSEANNKNFEISQNNYDTHVLNLIENMFLSKEMGSVRNACFHLKEELKENQELRQHIKEIFKMQITDNWGNFETFKTLVGAEIYNNYYAFERLARYFDTLSNYQLSDTTSNAIHYYYVWWRSLFIDMKECYLIADLEVHDTDKYISLSPNWITMVDRLDNQFLKFNLALE